MTFAKSRRDALKAAAATGAFAPLMKILGRMGAVSPWIAAPVARANVSPAKRLVVISYPNGAILRQWHPASAAIPADRSLHGNRAPLAPVEFRANQELSFALDPLREHAENLVALRGLNTLGHGGSSSHPEAASQILSGGIRNSDSFEASIANALEEIRGSTTGLQHFGLFNRYNRGKDYLMFRRNGGQPALPEDDPVRGADLLFGQEPGARPGSDEETDEELALVQKLQRDIQDKLSCCAAGPARTKLETHLISLQRLERTLTQRGREPACRPNNLVAMGEDQRENNEKAEEIVRSHWRVMASALACGKSSVLGFSFMNAQDESLFINFPSIAPLLDEADGGGFGSERKWWNQNRSHPSSHEANEVFAVQNRWYNMMIAELVKLLKATPDLSGSSLFDTTLICVVSENGESANHGQEDVGWYLFGGSSTPLGPGRIHDCGGKGGSDLFLEIARMMGINWSVYARSSGGIPGLRSSL